MKGWTILIEDESSIVGLEKEDLRVVLLESKG